MATPADDMERLVRSMARYLVANLRDGDCLDRLIDLVFWNLETRKDERCEGCGRTILQHSIEFFENGIDHNFAGEVR